MKRYSPIFYYTSVANFFFFLGNSLFILLPVYLKNLGATETYIGFMSNMDKIFMVATAVMLGSMLTQHNRVLQLRIGYGLLLLTYACYLPLTTLSWFLPFIRIAHGIGFAIAMILGSTIIFEHVPPQHATEAIGLYGITGALSNAVSPALGEFLLNSGAPHQVLFLLSVIFIAISCCITFVMPPTLERNNRLDAAPSGSLRRLVCNVYFIRYGIVSFIFGGGFGVLITFLPNFVRTCTQLNYSYFFVTYIVILILIRLFGMSLITRYHRKTLLISVFLIGALMNVLLNHLTSLPLFLIISIMYGITHGVLYPVLNALMVEIADSAQRGNANALFSALFNAGMLVFACSAGFLIDYTQTYLVAFNVCAGAFFIASILIASMKSITPSPPT